MTSNGGYSNAVGPYPDVVDLSKSINIVRRLYEDLKIRGS
jgi:hypothetical protein